MRLWSLHPRYLDAKGLVALWREGLPAVAVLRGKARGYRHHPQLRRFREHGRPVAAMRAYLRDVWREAARRGYDFDHRKIGAAARPVKIPVTTGQLDYETRHLLGKLRGRDPERYRDLRGRRRLEPHPLFCARRGGIEPWEILP